MLKRIPLLIFLSAFGLRLLARLFQGESEFWSNGYTLYFELAQNLVHKSQFILNTGFGVTRAYSPPVYPLFLALLTQGQHWYWPLIVGASAIGGLTALIIYFTGKELFNSRVATIAGFATALYPYYVFHDASLQETGIFTCLSTLSLYLILKSQNVESKWLWFSSGLVVGLALLTKATLQPFALLVLVWLGISNRQKFLLTTVGFCLIVSPWLLRNYVILGSPTFTSQSGRFLWVAHNPYTFSHYPDESIDQSQVEALRHLSPGEWNRIVAMSERDQSNYLKMKAIEYMKAHPGQTTRESLVKIQTAFSWKLNPVDSRLKQTVYFFSYFPILTLGLWGAWRSRKRWREFLPIYFLFVGFIVGSAVFWAHTSHRGYVDIYLILFSAYAVSKTREKNEKTRFDL